MLNAVVKAEGGHAALPTLLGQSPARIPTGGKIRAGIKVLTRKAEESAEARAIYEQGLAAGNSFVQIEKALAEALPNLKTPLVPKNVPWFTVRGQDFPNPEMARQILEMYGEVREDGVRRLYRFPVVFPSDFWQTVMPHELAAWGSAEKHYWSEYSADGRVRYCKHHVSAPLDGSGKRVIRQFGGRKTAMRERNGGLCDPESCPEYQRRQCNLTGRFLFFIPGIRSISAFELPTNSFYAMNMAIQKFETVSFLRGGRISGFLDRRDTPFVFSKRLMDVAHVDAEGRAVRQRQWIIDLEAEVDVTGLLRGGGDDVAAIGQAQMAVQVLERRSASSDANEFAPQERTSEANQPVDRSNVRTDVAARHPVVAPSESDHPPRSRLAGPVDRHGSTVKAPTFDQVVQRAMSYGISVAQYQAYADQRWGRGWRYNALGRQNAYDELERYRNDPQGYLDKMDCAIQGRS
jgi:hypothetical protein